MEVVLGNSGEIVETEYKRFEMKRVEKVDRIGIVEVENNKAVDLTPAVMSSVLSWIF